MEKLVGEARELGEGGKGTPNGVAVRAALIVLITAWETYVEDVCLEASEKLMASITKPSDLPHSLRSKIGQSSKDPWLLAGDAWREVARTQVSREVASLNTPSSKNVDALVDLAVGIKGALGQCAWANMSAEKIAEYVDQLIRIRGEIVHKGQALGDLNVKGVRYWCDWISILADRLDDVIRGHLAGFAH
jgi:hypothetical protein